MSEPTDVSQPRRKMLTISDMIQESTEPLTESSQDSDLPALQHTLPHERQANLHLYAEQTRVETPYTVSNDGSQSASDATTSTSGISTNTPNSTTSSANFNTESPNKTARRPSFKTKPQPVPSFRKQHKRSSSAPTSTPLQTLGEADSPPPAWTLARRFSASPGGAPSIYARRGYNFDSNNRRQMEAHMGKFNVSPKLPRSSAGAARVSKRSSAALSAAVPPPAVVALFTPSPPASSLSPPVLSNGSPATPRGVAKPSAARPGKFAGSFPTRRTHSSPPIRGRLPSEDGK